MRVLVVDDDPTAQKIMRLFLDKSGFVPMIHSNGSQVLELAQSADAPEIFILDWIMPGKDGLTLCKELRAARLRIRPYIILFSSRTSGQDIATALDAGADDFISKPFNVIETQARLRVARRLLDYQGELLQQIADNEELMQRNNLIGEIIHRKTGGRSPMHAAPKPRISATKPKQGEANPANFGLQEIRFLLSASLLELQLAVQSVQAQSRAPQGNHFHWCAWCPLLVVSHGLWIDITVNGAVEEVTGLFRKSVGRDPSSESERNIYFSELSRTIAAGFSRTLAVRAGTTIQPLMPRTRLADLRMMPTAIDTKAYELLIDGQMLDMKLSLTPSAALQLSTSQIQEFDILAEPFPPHSITEVPLFMEGVTLSPRFIEKMRHICEASSETILISCYRPSPVARFFNGFAS